MSGLVYTTSRDKVDVDTFHKGIQYALEKLGKSKVGSERTEVSNFKSKRHEGSGNELVDYFRVLVLTKRHVSSGDEIDFPTAHDNSCCACAIHELKINRLKLTIFKQQKKKLH